jgi:exodeoxyribonuclease VII large subunit
VEALAQRLDELELHLQRGMGRILEGRSQRLGFVHRRLAQQHPVRRLATDRDRLAALDRGLHGAVRRALASAAQRLGHARARLWAQSPVARIRHEARLRHDLHARMERAMDALVDRRRQGLAALADRLHGASPLAVLGRGYALVTAERDGRVVRMATQVEVGERVAVRLAEGGLLCEVLERREALTSGDRPARTDPHPPDRDR